MPKLLFSRLKKLATAPSAGGGGASRPNKLPAPQNYQNTAVVLALAFLALRLIILSNQAYPLYGDEAQYWVWGQDLDWGYFSKPPLIAWLIRLSTQILGNSEFGVRFFAPLLHFITQILIFVVARRHYGAATGLAASLIYGVMPGVAVSGMVMSTDAPLIMFWALSLYFLQNIFVQKHGVNSDKRAWSKNRIISVIGLGLALSLGMLSKYFMAVILLPIALTLMIMGVDKTNRQKMRRIAGDIGIALALAALLFTPNIWWNYQHAWVSVHHTGANAGVINGFLHIDSAGEFLLSQLAVFGPVAFLLLILIFWLYRHIFNSNRAENQAKAGTSAPNTPDKFFGTLLYLSSLVPILFIIVVALLSRAHANWAATAYVGGAILVAAYLTAPFQPQHTQSNQGKSPQKPPITTRLRNRVMAVLLMSQIVIVVGFYGFHDGARLLHINLSGRFDLFTRFDSGRVLGSAVSRVWLQHGMIPILTDHRMVYATLAFYMRPTPILVNYLPTGQTPKDHFQMISPLAQYREQLMLYVGETEYLRDDNLPNSAPPATVTKFRNSEPIGSITIPLYPDYRLRYRLYLVQGLNE